MVGLLIIGFLAGLLSAMTAMFSGGGVLWALGAYSLGGCVGMVVAATGRMIYQGQVPLPERTAEFGPDERRARDMAQWHDPDDLPAPEQDDDSEQGSRVA